MRILYAEISFAKPACFRVFEDADFGIQAAVKRWPEFSAAARLPAVDAARIQAAVRRI